MDWGDLEPGDVLEEILDEPARGRVFLVLAKSEGSLTTMNLSVGSGTVLTDRMPPPRYAPALLEMYRVLRGGRGA